METTNKKVNRYLSAAITFIGTILFFTINSWASECGTSTVCGRSCDYGDQSYDTVLIGEQCWFKENLNVGTMIGNLETSDNTAPTPNDPNTVSKWCYNNSSTFCDSEGGLYTWAESNGFADSCNTSSCDVPDTNQGICPAGWHVPSDTEFYALENPLTSSGQSCDATRLDWGCADAGTELKVGGSSGFDAVSTGNRGPADSQFDRREPSIHFWSSSPFSEGYTYGRILGLGYNTIGRWHSLNTYGFSVRCIANNTIYEEVDNETINNGATFSEDRRCLWKTPKETTWIKLKINKKDNISGVNLTWVQYDANKINIKIDDGTGNFPFRISNTPNDGHEFLPNVSPWQEVMIKPINHCKEGKYSPPVSYSTYSNGW